MDKLTACLTGFIVLCVTIIVGMVVYKALSGADSVVNSYMTGAFGVITGGSIALPIGYSMGKKSKGDENAET